MCLSIWRGALAPAAIYVAHFDAGRTVWNVLERGGAEGANE